MFFVFLFVAIYDFRFVLILTSRNVRQRNHIKSVSFPCQTSSKKMATDQDGHAEERKMF